MPESLVFSHAKISLNPCFLTFWSTEVDPYSLFNFINLILLRGNVFKAQK